MLATIPKAYIKASIFTCLLHWFLDNVDLGASGMEAEGHHLDPNNLNQLTFAEHGHGLARQLFAPMSLAAAANVVGRRCFGIRNDPVKAFEQAATIGFAYFAAIEGHRLAHVPDRERPAWATTLQEAGLLVSRKRHAEHHCYPWTGNLGDLNVHAHDVLQAANVYETLGRILFMTARRLPNSWVYAPNLIPTDLWPVVLADPDLIDTLRQVASSHPQVLQGMHVWLLRVRIERPRLQIPAELSEMIDQPPRPRSRDKTSPAAVSAPIFT
jgi:hypothetical protein